MRSSSGLPRERERESHLRIPHVLRRYHAGHSSLWRLLLFQKSKNRLLDSKVVHLADLRGGHVVVLRRGTQRPA